jgi:hypothetical protein
MRSRASPSDAGEAVAAVAGDADVFGIDDDEDELFSSSLLEIEQKQTSACNDPVRIGERTILDYTPDGTVQEEVRRKTQAR